MRVLISGASGPIGDALITELFKQGYVHVNILTRSPYNFSHSLPVEPFQWDPAKEQVDARAFEDVSVIINLAGAPIDQRWSDKAKQNIINSRIQSTKLLIKEAAKVSQEIKFLSASAIGYYGDSSALVTEDSQAGDDFMASVCKKWEEAAKHNLPPNIDLHIIRIGVVLSQKGGMLEKVLPIFKMNLGAKLGSGEQILSWIHIHDLVSIFLEVIRENIKSKVVNAVAPNPISNFEFTKSLASTLKKKTFIPVPAKALKLTLGEMSQIVLGSQNVKSIKLKDDFSFKFKTINQALSNLLDAQSRKEETLQQYQWIPLPKETVFDFFKEAKNLERITPPSLKFKILNISTEKIKQGSLIDYKIQINKIPVFWRTHIKTFSPPDEFIDEQLKGPYTKWHHHHLFFENKHGTLMLDNIQYKIPMGLFGKLLLSWYIRKDLKRIFDYRFRIISEIFNELHK